MYLAIKIDITDYNVSGSTDVEAHEAKIIFSNLLTSELRLQRLPVFGSIEERRARLKELLKLEQRLNLNKSSNPLRGRRERSSTHADLSSNTLHYAPGKPGCEKIIMVLLAIAADNF
jgi:hypothetical protein